MTFDDSVRRVIAEQHDEIAALKAENERLRGDLDTFIQACEGLHDIPAEDEILRLEKENDRLRGLVNSYADLFEKEAATNNGHGPYYSGENWLVLANDMRIDLAKCCGELRIEVKP